MAQGLGVVTLKKFQELSEVSNANTFLETATLCFASRCSLILIDLAADFTAAFGSLSQLFANRIFNWLSVMKF